MKFSSRVLSFGLCTVLLMASVHFAPSRSYAQGTATPNGKIVATDMRTPSRSNSPTVLSARVSDFDGDGRADLALLFYPPVWVIRYSATPVPQPACTWNATQSTSIFDFLAVMLPLSATGTPIPVPGDYNNDLRTDIAIYEGYPSTPNPSFVSSYFRLSNSATTPLTIVAPIDFNFPYGYTTDTPLMGDFSGDGRADFTVVREDTSAPVPHPLYWFIRNRVSPFPYIVNGIQWGSKDDYLIPGDYDGDGITDMTVWRPSTGVWWTLNSSSNFATMTSSQWGLVGDIPLLGDFDGDGKDDRAVYRPSASIWFVLNSATGTATASYWGTTGDIPVPADYDGDGKTEPAVYRPGTATWYSTKCPAQMFPTPNINLVPVPSVYVKKT